LSGYKDDHGPEGDCQTMQVGASLISWIEHRFLTLSMVDVVWIFVALAIIRLSRYAGMWIYALVALPGTLAHELAHFIVALILFAHPRFPSLIPIRIENGGWRLGSVAFHADYARAMPIAMAPLVLAPLALWWTGNFLHTASWPLYGMHVWLVAAMMTASVPSRVDFKLAMPALIALAVVSVIVVAIIWTYR
jgi:hypothetical protein